MTEPAVRAPSASPSAGLPPAAAGGRELDNLTPEQKRALLAQLLKQREGKQERSFPMSFSQQRLWFLDQLSPGNAFYNVEAAVPLPGALDLGALKAAINEIVRRHEVLRTVFRMVDGEPRQVVLPALTIEMPVLDLRQLPEADREWEVMRRRVEEATRPYDLASGPLLRVMLIRQDESGYLFLMGMHHIVSDGWSMGIFGREMTELYTAHVLRKPAELPELPIQYGDFAVWQRKHLSGDTLQEQLSYWKAQLDGLTPLELATDHPRPPVQTFRGAFHNVSLPEPLCRSLRQFSRREGVTLFMTLLAAFKILLYRYTGNGDVVVGTYIANRNRAEIEPLIGFFLNTLVLRTRVAEGSTVRELLQRVREMALGAYAHQDLPFEKLVEELHPDRDLSRNPLFQVTFQMTNSPTQQPVENAQAALDSKRGTAIFDLAFMLFETTRGVSGQFEYSTELFDAATIERMAGQYQLLLEGMVRDPDARIAELPLLPAVEERRVLLEWNATAKALPRDWSVVGLFEEQVDRAPESQAFLCDEGSITYGDLDVRANRVAHELIRTGVRPGAVVALCMERTLALPAALLGILKAGAAYLPLDPTYPRDRLAYMLADSGAGVLLADRAGAELLADFPGRIVPVDDGSRAPAAVAAPSPEMGVAAETDAARRPGLHAAPDDLAYLIYTSGSTGRPKGIATPHRQLRARLEWMWRDYPFMPREVCCQKTALSFVDSVWELIGPLLRGVPTLIIPDATVRDPRRLVRELERHQVTRIWLVPSLLAALLDHFPDLRQRLPSLDFWVSSGEPLAAELLHRFQDVMPDAALFNLYGTSEVWDATWYDPRQAVTMLHRVPIGKPVDNVRVYVLDGNRRPVPIGAPGELYVAGDGLAAGYVGKPDLTAERFVTLSLPRGIRERAYRTGDRARWRADGNLEYLGRLDQQLKVRGYRVEPAEVEGALSEHPALRGVAVVAEEMSASDARLIACVVPRGATAPQPEELRLFLLDRVPPYMVPSRFVIVDELPLTPSGKVDRLAVARLLAERPDLAHAYVAPRPGLEETIARIWMEVLRLERVGSTDNFFDLGGHSLLATQVMSRLNALLEFEVPLRQLFETPTIAGMATAIEPLQGRADSVARAPTIPRLSRDLYRMDLPSSRHGDRDAAT